MCDRDVVDRSARLFGRAVTPIAARDPTRRDPYVTSIKGKPAIRLMIELARLMSEVRREQIRRALRDVVSTELPTTAWAPTVAWLAALLEGEAHLQRRLAMVRG
jgi:hypothetical protein